MADTIQRLFFDPSIAIARLGGSSTPQDAFVWAPAADPHLEGETVVVPTWSLRVLPDFTVEPFLPSGLQFREDGPAGTSLIRPVAPFLELWALVGDAKEAAGTWRPEPVTEDLLKASGADLTRLTFRVTAMNRKAERRTRGNAAMAFGTQTPVAVRADDHAVKALEGRSPPATARQPQMIPDRGPAIPLGSVQVLKTKKQPDATATPVPAWIRDVRVDVVRLRFTPARGLVYGPASAARPIGSLEAAVPTAQAFLSPASAFPSAASRWEGTPLTTANDPIDPGDTYDSDPTSGDARNSLGVVDDTCDAVVEATLALPAGRSLSSSARVFVAPPAFAPDRRPFVSAADDINDREADAASRNTGLNAVQQSEWVEDLFERIYETAALFNVDAGRLRGFGGALVPTARLRAATIANDGVRDETRAMGGRDPLRNPDFSIPARSDDNPLPLSQHARSRHRTLADILRLRDFVVENRTRMFGPPRGLVRPPFGIGPEEAPEVQAESERRTTMQMPPFMQQIDGGPMSLCAWQYDLLKVWHDAVVAGTLAPIAELAAGPSGLSPEAEERLREVLEALEGVE